MQKELIAGETIIGQINGKYKGIYRNFNIVYGNVADVVVNGKTLHLDELEYRKMLDNFLNSNSGTEYRRPSDNEIISTMKIILNEEARINAEKQEKAEQEKAEKMEAEKQKEEARIKEQNLLKQKEIEAMEASNALKKVEISKINKRTKILNIILIVLGVLVLISIAVIVYLYFQLKASM